MKGGDDKTTKFKVIPNTNGAYSISPEGQVLSNARLIKRPITASGNYYTKDRILKWTINNKGYAYVDLRINKKTCRQLVHRLVALTYIPNPKNLPLVNHKDFDPLNNKVDNLEWCTASENIQYSAKRGRYSNMSAAKIASSTAPRPYLYRAVDQYDANGIYIQTFASITAASQYLRQEGKIQNAVSGKTNIVAVCKGTAHTCGGYKWKYHADK